MENTPYPYNEEAAGNELDSVKKSTGKTVGEWYKEFKLFPFIVLSFIFLLMYIYQNYSIKSGWQSEKSEYKATIASKDREIYLKDSISQARIDLTINNWQVRYDRLSASKDSILILYGAKKALER